MPKKYRVCSRTEINGKAVYPDTGMTLTVRDDGRMYLYDPRTLQSYFCFEKEPRNQQGGQSQPQQQPRQQPQQNKGFDDFDDDIPF
jgi:single-stranded DNA-binding protein